MGAFGAATGLSAMVEEETNHDQVTGFLSEKYDTSTELWRQVRPVVRSIVKEKGVLIFDYTIQEKACTDESDLMCWHYHHVSGRSAKGINLLNALYHAGEHSISVAVERVRKPIKYCDIKTRQIKRM